MNPTKQVDLPDWPWRTVQRLARERGVRVWPVGGAVRDLLLGRPVHDWDFAVSRDALGLARAVADALGGAYFPLDTERGTGRVILDVEKEEGKGKNARLELDFALLRGGSLEADLWVRDFTINAMAVTRGGRLIDPTGGEADLEAGRIRATDESALRDDPVRLLRAVRLEVDLGFEIQPQTVAWIRRNAALLGLPAAERVRDEFVRLLTPRGAAAAVRRLDELGLLVQIMPELGVFKGVTQSPPHSFDVWEHTLRVVDALEGVVAAVAGRSPSPALANIPPAAWGDVERRLGQFAVDVEAHLAVGISSGRDRATLLRLVALLHDVGKPETWSQDEEGRIHFYDHDVVGARIAAAGLGRLRFSRDEIGRARTMIKAHLRPLHLARGERVTRRAVYRYFRDTGSAGVEVALLALADHLATWGPNLRERRWGRRLEVAEILLTHYFERREQTVAPPPLITGRDLMAELGLQPGPEIGQLLESVQEAQAAGEVSTREEALALARRVSEGSS